MSAGFERPLVLVLGAAALILGTLLFRRSRDALTLDIPLGPPGGIPFKPPFGIELLTRLLLVLDFSALALLFTAAAGPRLISTDMVWLNRGADILFVLDISPSMAGIDMDGRSRFDAARELVREFARSRPSDAIGLVGVGNEASLLVPPTVDRGVLFSRLEGLRIGELGDGTALGMGLAVAALHIRPGAAAGDATGDATGDASGTGEDRSRKATVLITDGENNAGTIHPETAAALLRELGVSLWVIGVGSTGEVPIDYVDPFSRMRRTGVFDSRFDPEKLRSIARAGEGTFIAAPSGQAFAGAFARVNQGELVIRRSGTLTREQPFHRPLILLALLCICLSRFIRRFVLGALL
jgi:Ca-activated chloride channel family protein